MTEIVENNNEVRTVLSVFERGKAELGRIVSGQTELIEQAILTFLCGGHALVEGVPGVAKTMTVKTLARFLALDFRRIQGTPDMMPADILGTSVFSLKTSDFTFHRGPVFTQFLLADEINRMPPRTQAALLESMEERQVTIDGETHTLDDFFTVFATQNPLEFEGTYPLPEAQLDRFLIKIRVPYPNAAEERVVLERITPRQKHRNSNRSRLPVFPPRIWSRRVVSCAPSASSRRCSITSLLLCGARASGPPSPSGPARAPLRICSSWPKRTPRRMAATFSFPTT
jgi:MoxR-like ATPase